MRLYSMHKREFVMVFLAFFACFGLALFIGIAGLFSMLFSQVFLLIILGPPITSTTAIDGKSLLGKDNRSNSIATGPFIMKTTALTTYAQQLWLIATLATENTDGNLESLQWILNLIIFVDEVFDKSFYVAVGIEGLDEEHKPVLVLDNKHTNNR